MSGIKSFYSRGGKATRQKFNPHPVGWQIVSKFKI